MATLIVWLIVMLPVCGWFLWTMGVLTGRMRSDREHIAWLDEMDREYGEVNPFYRAEADRLRQGR